MAHGHHSPSPGSHGPAPAHGSADAEYFVTPPGSGHEHTDASVWSIVKVGSWLLISAILIHIGLGFLFGLWVKQSEETVAEFPLATGQEHRLPAAPRLQQFPENEFHDFQLKERAVLERYGWVDKEAGVVRLPIEEAMRRIVSSGLPQSQPAAVPRETPGLMPADSSAGRTTERRRQ